MSESVRVPSAVVPGASRPAEAHVPALDGVRGLAIAGVLWHHLAEPYLPLGSAHWLGWLRAAGSLTWTGVDLFFVLSGYLIGGILLDYRTSPRLPRTFYARRAARILPLYYVTLAVVLLVALPRFAHSFVLFPGWVYGLFLTNFALAVQGTWDWYPLSVLWSIAVEEQFYLAAPWIVRWIKPATVPVLMVGLIVLAWGLRVVAFHFDPSNSLVWHVPMPMRMDTLACGVLLAWAVRNESATPFFRWLARAWPACFAVGAACFVFLTGCHYLGAIQYQVYAGYTIVALVYACVLAVVVAVRPPLLVRVLSTRVLCSLGRCSYFIYLWHMLIAWGVIRWLGGTEFILNTPRSLAIVLAGIGATWLAALGSGKFFETPLLRLGRKLKY